MVNLSDISQSLQSGKAVETSDLIARAIEENYSADTILKQGVIPGMRAVKARYMRKEIYQPELLIAARAMNMGIRTLRPLIALSMGNPKGTVIIGTVKGDIQDIEKNLMALTMEGAGLRVIDLGIGVSADRFIEAAIMERARIIFCTANLPATMGQLKLVVHAATASGIRGRIKIMVSGAPVTEKYCHVIEADIYARDMVNAAEMAGSICGGDA
ncbi:cobalamin-binding protein [Treponema primitia]|uniref:cobalamin-binding protein n=1 Tax=Treponema primitia TaxID=88058 RepID=UPI0002555148|nr:cobalamin-binding protein [Treponema primitia]